MLVANAWSRMGELKDHMRATYDGLESHIGIYGKAVPSTVGERYVAALATLQLAQLRAERRRQQDLKAGQASLRYRLEQQKRDRSPVVSRPVSHYMLTLTLPRLTCLCACVLVRCLLRAGHPGRNAGGAESVLRYRGWRGRGPHRGTWRLVAGGQMHYCQAMRRRASVCLFVEVPTHASMVFLRAGSGRGRRE